MTESATALERRQQPATGATALARRDPLLLGKVLAASGYFKDARDENQAVVKVIAGQEMGFGSVAAMTGIHIIDGKPVVGANLMAAKVKSSPRYEYRVEHLDNQRCTLSFYERSGDEWLAVGESTFTWDDAVTAGVTSKHNWKHYPRNMLFARALSNGVTFYCPDLLAGAPVYTPEELDVELDEETGDVAADVPPAPPPRSVARSRAEATASAPEPTEPLITVPQRRKLWKVADEAGIKGDESLIRAIVLWVSGEAHTDRIPRSKVDAVFDAIKDHEATYARIQDEAAGGDQLAREIIQRFFGNDPGPDDGDPGPEQQELGA